MDGIGLEKALDLIQENLSMPLATEGQVDVWRCRYEYKMGVGVPGGDDVKVERWLMADDKNFLVAVFVCSSARDAITEHGPKEAVRKLRIEGNKIRRTTLDAGLHRLVVLMILSDKRELHEAISKEVPQANEGLGQFRVVLLPHADQSEAAFQDAYRMRRAAIGPLPADEFLRPIEDTELVFFC
jgi:hypothetical protein